MSVPLSLITTRHHGHLKRRKLSMNEEKIQRSVLPIPDRLRCGLIAFDGKDRDTKFPPIKQRRRSNGIMTRH
jgi:hypothetical protein